LRCLRRGRERGRGGGRRLLRGGAVGCEIVGRSSLGRILLEDGAHRRGVALRLVRALLRLASLARELRLELGRAVRARAADARQRHLHAKVLQRIGRAVQHAVRGR
jgi:hypothetical protein